MSVLAPEKAADLSADFKEAMRRLASTVAIITAREGDTWFGMAATAVMSVSTTPPCLVIAVNRTASLHPPVTATRKFCVNLLDIDHRDLVDVFSGKLKGPERFQHGDWAEGEGGLPYLRGAAACLFCDLDVEIDHATHTLFIGAVSGVVNAPGHDPLVWVNGRSSRVVGA
ncbi:hypothetical protein BH10PSE4_BH10PSE4_00930 [soil metagenome]